MGFGCAATVARSGAVLLGDNIEVDGFYGRLVRVVTHAHSDHIIGLSKSLRRALFIIATPVTFRMLDVLGNRVPRERRIPLEYGRGFMFEDEIVRFAMARHIAGSAQVVVESRRCRVGYTGDFKMPGTEPLEDLDVLVLDATYGDPSRQRTWSDRDALEALVSLIENSIGEGPVWIYGYNGKLQEIMVELRRSGVRLPYYADPRTIRLAEIASEFYNVELGGIGVFSGTSPPPEDDAIVFVHTSRRRRLGRMPGTHIVLTGWEMRGVVVRVGPRSYNVSFSDHATLQEILEYLYEARPRIVVVDAYRGGSAEATARYIERVTGIRALAMPPRPVGYGSARRTRPRRAYRI